MCEALAQPRQYKFAFLSQMNFCSVRVCKAYPLVLVRWRYQRYICLAFDLEIAYF